MIGLIASVGIQLLLEENKWENTIHPFQIAYRRLLLHVVCAFRSVPAWHKFLPVQDNESWIDESFAITVLSVFYGTTVIGCTVCDAVSIGKKFVNIFFKSRCFYHVENHRVCGIFLRNISFFTLFSIQEDEWKENRHLPLPSPPFSTRKSKGNGRRKNEDILKNPQ